MRTSVSAPKPGMLSSFRDWTIGCDNGRTCEAVVLTPQGQHDDMLTVGLSIFRAAGADAGPVVRIAADAIKDGPVTLHVDGVKVGAMRLAHGRGELTGPQGAALALAMARGGVMEVRRGTSVLMRPSLSGAAAALRQMDASQKRAGTTTALVAIGALGPQAVAAAPRLPVVTPAAYLPPKADQARPALWQDERRRAEMLTKCTDTFDQSRDPELYPLSKHETLVLLPCGSGAYNMLSAVLIATGAPGRRQFVRPAFDMAPGWGEEGGPVIVVNPKWKQAEARLESRGKGRGVGDCGDAESFVWDGESFRLVDAKEMDECRGATTWITTWRAMVGV